MTTDRELLQQAAELLSRYRHETPSGHQPHMIAHTVDDLLDTLRARLAEPDDTEARVQRIMEAAYEYASTAALVRDALDAREERAELERIVRETLR